MLALKKIKKNYVTDSETVYALRGIDLSFRSHEFVSILGPSGCGKTTLLNIIGGLDHYTSGDLVINGKSTKAYRDKDWDVYRNHRIGFIFQSYNLIPHQTVLGNVELALTIAGVGRKERIERAKAALDKVGLSGHYYKKPNQLSGGQCQRVAIARALVNDPEILLADEPTGALDSVTSVQIMDLIREISEERLVIMVTHNPKLAELYSSRIIKLQDGMVLSDSNPMTSREIANEEKADIEAKKAAKKQRARNKKPSRESAKMSFFTAFRLSARNLISKKGRTTMVGIAGSIGIIGIAMVLAFSAGIKGYVASMQDDMLSGNPITITENTYDLDALTGMMDMNDKVDFIKEAEKVYINSLIEYFAKMNTSINSMLIKNDINENYLNYIKAIPSEYYAAMMFGYGIDMTNNIYTEFREEIGGESQEISISALTNIYTSILEKTDFADLAAYVTSIVPSFKEAPNNSEYINSQYQVYGDIADEANELMIVLDSKNRLTDLLLARLGYYSQEEFLNIINEATESESFDEAAYREYFTYEEILGKKFTWYPNDTVFKENATSLLGAFSYNHTATDFSKDGSVELSIVGILVPNDNIMYGCLSSGIYYTEELTKYVLEENGDSKIVNNLKDSGKDSFTSMNMNGMATGITYTYTYHYNGETYTEVGFVGESYGNMSGIISSMGGMMPSAKATAGSSGGSMGGLGGLGGLGGSGSGIDLAGIKVLSLRALGGVNLANSITIYPIDFANKDLVTDYLDAWNGEGDVSFGDTTVSRDDRTDITYTDALDLVIAIINTLIDAISTALIAFTSVSLIVSTVMIGIITYVSVVERIKEIGVIRSLGGRKRDVSRLFNAETFIIGLLSGIIGITVSYIASAIVSAIVENLVGISNIATLPTGQAMLLIGLSIMLTLISGIIPASSAAKKDPVVALRTE